VGSKLPQGKVTAKYSDEYGGYFWYSYENLKKAEV